MRHKILVGLAAAALLGASLVTACRDDAAAGTPEAARIIKDTDDEAVVELPDGRRVSLRYEEGTGLLERHRRAKDKPWSASKTLYATGTEPCQGIDLTAHSGTVTVRAGFGTYCRDGEPPMESVAAVGTGGFGRWDAHLSEDWDGWDRVDIADDGRSATFRSDSWSGRTTLSWRLGQGFGEQTTTYKKLGERFLGTWRAADGSHQVTFRQREPNRPATATVKTIKGTGCTFRMPLFNIWEDKVQPRGGELLEGEKTTYCPPEEFNSEYVLESPDGALSLRNLGETQPLVTYRKS